MKKAKEPIKVRLKPLKNGGASIYLDIYIDGCRSYEFLKLYLIPEQSSEDKERNRQTMRLANAIKAQRIIDIQNDNFGFQSSKRREWLFDYAEHLAKEDGMKGIWTNFLQHLKCYDDKKPIHVADVTPSWCNGFKKHLDEHVSRFGKPLSLNTKNFLFSKMRSVLEEAKKEGIIRINPALVVKNYRKEESNRQYLTIAELEKLIATPFPYDDIRRMFLFSCFTGLRNSDIRQLRWSDVMKQEGYTRLVFRQKKTHGQEYTDINEQAVMLMGDAKNGNELVFPDVHDKSYSNKLLQQWVYKAGIDKKITFHCGRHTFAVMMLERGADIYTVSKLLGHRDLSTTQIYAKVVDKSKRKAVDLLPKLL